MALKVVKRKSTGAYTISGTILGRRIQLRAATNNRHLAEEQAASLEARILREQWHGPKTASRTIGEAMVSYCRSCSTQQTNVQEARQALRDDRQKNATIGDQPGRADTTTGEAAETRCQPRNVQKRGHYAAGSGVEFRGETGLAPSSAAFHHPKVTTGADAIPGP